MDELCRSRRGNEIQQHRMRDGVVFSRPEWGGMRRVPPISGHGKLPALSSHHVYPQKRDTRFPPRGRPSPLTVPRPPLEGRRDTDTRVHEP